MLKSSVIDPVAKQALREDVGMKDITTSAIIPKNLQIKAAIEMHEPGVLCGIEIAERVFRLVDENIRFLPVAKDGELIEQGREIAYIEGLASGILIAERTALNFLTYLSGIATKTREFVEKVKGTSAKILDTRKTTPTLRAFEKYAVAMGGGTNHRMGLYDQVLIKDNHLRIMRDRSLKDLVGQAKRSVTRKTPLGIEVKNLAELKEALKTCADYILLDNMTPVMVESAVELRKKSGVKIPFEVSGGVNIDNVLAYAKSGVERISVGVIIHGAPSLDISLDIVA